MMRETLYVLERRDERRTRPFFFIVPPGVSDPTQALYHVAKRVYERLRYPGRFNWKKFLEHATDEDFLAFGIKRLGGEIVSRHIDDKEVLLAGGEQALQVGDRVRVRDTDEKGIIREFSEDGTKAYLEIFGLPEPPLYERPVKKLVRY